MPAAPRVLRRFTLLAAASILAAWCLPGTAIDRFCFRLVSRATANPPLVIHGAGSHTRPWTLQTLAAHTPRSRMGPAVVELGDDPHRYFQENPPGPTDIAVILTNMRRLGASHAAIGATLAWDHPDVIAVAALDHACAAFESVVMAAPLTRGAVPEPMPAAFRRASWPIDSIHGDPSDLPRVNRLSIPGTLLAKDPALAGFQTIESEPPAASPRLLARWGDRVIASFTLLAALQQVGLSPAEIRIHPGDSIRCASRPDFLIPIHADGTLRDDPLDVASSPIAATELIDLQTRLTPLALLLDTKSIAEPATRAFSAAAPSIITTLAKGRQLTKPTPYPRPTRIAEILLLAAVVIATTLTSFRQGFTRTIGQLGILFVILASCWIAHGLFHIWLPMIALLTPWILSAKHRPLIQESRSRIDHPSQAAEPPSSPTPTDTEPTPAVKPTRKRATKKTPVKKAAKAPIADSPPNGADLRPSDAPKSAKPARKTPRKKASTKRRHSPVESETVDPTPGHDDSPPPAT